MLTRAAGGKAYRGASATRGRGCQALVSGTQSLIGMLILSRSTMNTNGDTTVDKSLASIAHHGCPLAPASLRDLPVEVHVLVMESLPDFSVLKKFIYAFPRMVRILKGFQKRIFTGVLRSSKLSLQLQKIITAIMTLRERYPATPCPTEAFFDRYLDRKDQPIDITKFANPIGMLRYMARTMESINQYVESFVQKRILIHDIITFPLSDTESYRVHRAFWRFQLCYELTHPGGSVYVAHNAESPKRWSRRYIGNEDGIPVPRPTKGWLSCRERPRAHLLTTFLQTLYPWEIEEINVARFHLTTVVNAFQYNRTAGTPDDLRNENLLLQRLVMDLDNWHEGPEFPTDHLLVADLRVSPRDYDLCHEPIWPQNPLEAGSVNIEPNDLNGLQYARAQWGWCMWDVPRLQAFGFTGLSSYIEDARIGTAAESFTWDTVRAFINAQFSAIDNELTTRFRNGLQRELQAHEQEKHIRRKEWLMTWVSSRDPALYQEWRDVCAMIPFNQNRAQSCYLLALTRRREENGESRPRPR